MNRRGVSTCYTILSKMIKQKQKKIQKYKVVSTKIGPDWWKVLVVHSYLLFITGLSDCDCDSFLWCEYGSQLQNWAHNSFLNLTRPRPRY